MAQPIPQDLSHLIALNVEYNVLICLNEKCKYALKPTAFSRHLNDKHNTPLELRKQVDQYVKEFPFVYDNTTVPLPVNGLAPQPIIPIVDGFVCRDCPFKTASRAWMRQHANKTHNKKEVANEELCCLVRLQSWFGEKRERYWVVNEVQQACRATVRDVGEESNDSEAGAGSGSGSDSGSDEDSQNDDDDYNDIIQGIENWKADARERLLEALKKVPAAEIDSWLQFTGWNEVLGQSKHNLVKTHQFACAPDPNEPELERVLRA
jgi:Orsellinic acid/F9775 biosynthesis cluster protein D